jgi:hypothetical protein
MMYAWILSVVLCSLMVISRPVVHAQEDPRGRGRCYGA